MKQRILEKKLCDDCVSRFICPVKGRACMGHNSKEVFKGLLKQFCPDTNWDMVLDEVEQLTKKCRGYHSNE